MKKMEKVTGGQIKKIYAAARELGMDRDLLHEHMEMLVHRSSVRDLTKDEAITLIDSLEGKGVTGKGHATKRQMSYIYTLMRELEWTTEDGKPDLERLNRFLQSDKAGFKLDDYRWLKRRSASDLIEALKSMLSRKQEKEVAG